MKSEKEMEILREYYEKFCVKEVANKLRDHSAKFNDRIIAFPNGWCASIIQNDYADINLPTFSVAVCDHNGKFDWSVLNGHGTLRGCFYCHTELDVIIACETIRRLPDNKT